MVHMQWLVGSGQLIVTGCCMSDIGPSVAGSKRFDGMTALLRDGSSLPCTTALSMVGYTSGIPGCALAYMSMHFCLYIYPSEYGLLTKWQYR